MGNFINNLLDNLLSTLWRVLDLPLYSLLIGLLITLFILSILIKKIFKTIDKKKLIYINAAVIFFFLILIVDKKFRQLHTEINSLNEKISELQFSSSDQTQFIRKTDFVYEIDSLRTAFPDAKVYEKTIHEAIDIISYKTTNPNVVAYISVIDLMHPSISVKVTPEKKDKYLTTTFAEENNCIVAINGEAGESMALDCELGEWSGNWVSDGNPVMLVDSDKRPFIGFEKNNTAHYSVENIIDTVLDEKKYNAIWGRFDILTNGKVLPQVTDNPYARTIMGTNQEGSVLFLMIVDGKRPDYSEGLTYVNCARILKALGADYAMACDQGGSSCMYVKPMGGIINRPADSDGYERPIYSHFGISI